MLHRGLGEAGAWGSPSYVIRSVGVEAGWGGGPPSFMIRSVEGGGGWLRVRRLI